MSKFLFIFIFLAYVQLSLCDVVVNKSYGERISNAFWGVLVGIFLVIISVPTIWIIERDAVEYFLILTRCKKATRKLCDSSIDYKFDNRPVFLKGITNIDQNATSKDHETGFVFKQQACRLKRIVEVYQWVEHSKQEEKKTVYSYTLEWSELDHNSKTFKESSGHYNCPREPALQSKIMNASSVHVGSFLLCQEQVDKLELFTLCPITVEGSKLKCLIERGPKSHTSSSGMYFV